MGVSMGTDKLCRGYGAGGHPVFPQVFNRSSFPIGLLLPLFLSASLHRHHQPFCPGELFLVGIEGQELRDSKLQSGGHVQNVRHSTSFGERVGTAQRLCALMHSRPVHRRHGEQPRVEINLEIIQHLVPLHLRETLR